ncbi:MAG: hypothetical protein V4702_05020 [Patescibacteria group bacterium]
MIQFNLLPDVKREYVRARRNKRMTLLIASLAAGAAFAVLVILFVGVQIFQKKYSADLSKDIKSESSKLKGIQDLEKILTIQNQLAILPELHNKKPVATRTLDYFKQVTPAKASIAKMNLDYDTQIMNITGAADAISTINKFVDTLKFTTYKTEDGKEGNAFNSVVLSTFGRDDKGASYQITFKFDPIIFSNDSPVALTVPAGKITTRSETEKPDSLFQPLSNPNPTGQ